MEVTGSNYSGSAYHPSLGNEMASGDITVSQWTFYFRSETVALDLPLQGLQLDVPKRDADRIAFVHANHPGWRVYTNDFDILEDPSILAKTALRQQVQKINQQGVRWPRLLGITLVAFSGFMLLMLGIFLVTGWTLNYVVNKVPPTYEEEIGKEVFNELEAYLAFSRETNTAHEVEALAKRFISEHEQKRFNFRFYIIETPEPNAMALPGGRVLVTTGLIELADAEELTGVLAHEVAHVTRRHGVKQIASTVGPYLLLKALLQNDKGFLGLIGHNSRMLVTQNFSQKYEIEADEGAWDYVVKANINPRALITCLKKLQEHEGEANDQEIGALASHPPTSERIRRLEKKWGELKRKNGFVELPPVKLPKRELWDL